MRKKTRKIFTLMKWDRRGVQNSNSKGSLNLSSDRQRHFLYYFTGCSEFIDIVGTQLEPKNSISP